jgi:hypothetical protein
MRITALALSSLGATSLFCSTAQAEDLAASGLVVPDAELANIRGGFAWNGVDVQLGAEIRSYIKDELVMQTTVSWTATGMQTTRFTSAALSSAGEDGLRAGLLDQSLALQNGRDAVFVANGGQTAFIHRTDGALQNVVLNTASQTQLRQETNVRLDLGNFAPLEGASLRERIGSGLSGMISGALSGAGGF